MIWSLEWPHDPIRIILEIIRKKMQNVLLYTSTPVWSRKCSFVALPKKWQSARTGNKMKYFCEIRKNWKCETSLVLLLSTVRSLWGNEFEFTSIFPIIIISPATLRNNDVKTKHKIISHIHIIKLSYIWRLLRSCGFRFSERNVHCSSRSILNSRYQIYWAKK